MPLIDLKTDLKSLRYGNDTLGGGNSGQPYIQKDIPDGFGNLGLGEDFILRGGVNAVADSITDVSRLTKMFFDLKSPNGLFFVAKQQLLSRTAVRTQTSGVLNEGVYNPLNTLAQAGVNALGIHLKKQGVNPFAQTGAYSNNDSLYGVRVKTDQPADENRLFSLYELNKEGMSQSNWNFSGIDLNVGVNVLSYGGGPGSDLGIGKTNIRYASPEQRTGKQNKYFNTSYFTGTSGSFNPSRTNSDNKSYIFSGSVSGLYERFTRNSIDNGFNDIGQNLNEYNVYTPEIAGTFPENTDLIYNNGTDTLDQEQIIGISDIQYKNSPNVFTPSTQIDFRRSLRIYTDPNTTKSSIMSKAPSYSEGNGKTIDGGFGPGRVNQLSPGRKGNIISYTAGKRDANGSLVGATDRINALPIYKSENVTGDNVKNDLVKFRIAAIDNNDPSFKTFMHFRALLGSISDSYNSTWNPTKYLGRGEDFYTYGGFSRSVSLSWTVAAQSKAELIPMYKKLNYLASTMAPDYSPNGYMRGNLMQLTIGGYFYEQKGFFTTLEYSMPEDSTWEIGINDSGNYDPSVKELTHRIEVTAAFTPIHDFIPKKMVNEEIDGVIDDQGLIDGNKYGPERFIALSTSSDTNLSNYGSVFTQPTPQQAAGEEATRAAIQEKQAQAIAANEAESEAEGPEETGETFIV